MLSAVIVIAALPQLYVNGSHGHWSVVLLALQVCTSNIDQCFVCVFKVSAETCTQMCQCSMDGFFIEWQESLNI